jgi:pimeloyl-ACP methyl ester carboxylesterase
MSRMKGSRVGLLVFVTLAAACGFPNFDIETAKHVLTVDEYGRLIDTAQESAPAAIPEQPEQKEAVRATNHPGPDPTDLIQKKIDGILQGTESHLEVYGKRRVMIFAHGGLNSWDASSETIHRLMKRIEWDKAPANGGTPDPYPIFVQWNSEPFHCLWEHLVWIRQGRVKTNAWLLATPLYFVADLGRGIVTLPVRWFMEVENTFGTSPSMQKNATKRYCYYHDHDAIDDARLGRGGDPQRGFWRATVDVAGNVVYFPLRAATMPIVDGFGEPAWENMVRRTRMLFHTEEEFGVRDGRLPEGSGAMAIFLRRLQQAVTDHGGPDKWDITLVGHSMGSMVCAETLRMAPSLPVRDVVFMAAACSLREYRDSVLPFLSMPEHSDARMHHLVLSDWAEEHESWPKSWFEVVPRGSLLVWIDSFLASPETLLDRTAGRYVNLMAATHLDDSLPPALRARITVRQFSSGPDEQLDSPQGHGEFIENVKFWKSASWKPLEELECESQ